MPTPFNLPEEVVDFLRDAGQLYYDADACEPGEVGLHQLRELKLGEVWVAPDAEGDPNCDKSGSYKVPAVSLTGTCRVYDPEYILLWLPNEKQFGTWDCDHGILIVFEDTSWEDILISPAQYIGAQWELNSGVGRRLEVWNNYPFELREKPF